MYPIDLNTCTADEVIARSVTCHPTLFAAALQRAAAVHEEAAVCTTDKVASKVARKAAQDCRDVAMWVELEDLTLETLTFGERTQAFTVAARLQSISPVIAALIIGRNER